MWNKVLMNNASIPLCLYRISSHLCEKVGLIPLEGILSHFCWGVPIMQDGIHRVSPLFSQPPTGKTKCKDGSGDDGQPGGSVFTKDLDK